MSDARKLAGTSEAIENQTVETLFPFTRIEPSKVGEAYATQNNSPAVSRKPAPRKGGWAFGDTPECTSETADLKKYSRRVCKGVLMRTADRNLFPQAGYRSHDQAPRGSQEYGVSMHGFGCLASAWYSPCSETMSQKVLAGSTCRDLWQVDRDPGALGMVVCFYDSQTTPYVPRYPQHEPPVAPHALQSGRFETGGVLLSLHPAFIAR